LKKIRQSPCRDDAFEIAKGIRYIGFLFENPESGEVEVSLIQNEKL